MRSILLFLFICILASCSKELSVDEKQDTKFEAGNFLQFDIQNISYDTPDTAKYTVYLNQIDNQSFELLDLSVVPRYLWFMPYNTPEDSLNLIGKISFELVTELNLPYDKIDMEFSFIEAKDKLLQVTDSTYKYKSLADFHILSKNTGWGEAYNGKKFEINNIMITIPEPIQVSSSYTHYISSNGFYFEDETIQTSTSAFNVEDQSLRISGAFNVKFKELSCGFYMTHNVTNARFQVEIQ